MLRQLEWYKDAIMSYTARLSPTFLLCLLSQQVARLTVWLKSGSLRILLCMDLNPCNQRCALTRKEKWFAKSVYPRLRRAAVKTCKANNHAILWVKGWSQYQKGVNEMGYCVHCGMKVYIQLHPPVGYDHLHGVALAYHCNKRSQPYG